MHNKTLIYARDFLPFGRKLSRDERMKIEDFYLACNKFLFFLQNSLAVL